MHGARFILQTRAADGAVVETLVWSGALVVAVVLLSIAVVWMRRRLFAPDRVETLGVDDVSRMKDHLSAEEYDLLRAAAKRRLMRQVSAAVGEQPPPRTPAPRSPDELRAPPGFDLTGAPLPPPADQPPAQAP